MEGETLATVQQLNSTSSFQNKLLLLQCTLPSIQWSSSGQRVSTAIIYNVRKFFNKCKRRSELLKVGYVTQITAEVGKNRVKLICSEGAVISGSFSSPEKHFGAEGCY